MKKQLIIPTAEPFYFPGNKIGCVLVHGFTGSPKEMRGMGEFLSNSGLSVLGIRLAGHATTPQDLIRTRWTDWLASVEDGINILSNVCEKVFVIGLSLGGILTLISASRYPIQGAIAMSTPCCFEKEWRLKMAKPLSRFIPFIRKDQSEVDVNDQLNHVDYPQYPSRSLAEVYTATKIFRRTLKDIKMPVLIIHSKSDQTVSYRQSSVIVREISAADVQHITLDKSGHVVTEGPEKDIVYLEALKFIQSISKKIK